MQAVPESSEPTALPQSLNTMNADSMDMHVVSTANNVDSAHETTVSNGQQATSSNDIDSFDSIAASNAMFSRQFTSNPAIDPNMPVDYSRQFSVVSYNVLAECHASKTPMPWISAEHLSAEYRNKKLLQELQYLDADVVCLQEVEPEQFSSALLPAMKM